MCSFFPETVLPRYFTLIRLARLPGILWSLLGVWVIYRWGDELFGKPAGCFGVALWCFEPTVLAHAQLVTIDIPCTTVGAAATFGFWRYLRRPSSGRALFVGALLGIAQLTKFTLLALYVAWFVLWLVDRPWRAGRAGGAKVAAGQALLILGTSLYVLNLGYQFEGTGRWLADYSFRSRSLGRIGESVLRHLGNVPVPLPEDYLLGIDDQRGAFEVGQPSYLAGRWKDSGGWWYYYLYALGVKVPLGMIVLACWGTALAVRASAHFLVDGKDFTEPGGNPENGFDLWRQCETTAGKSG